MVPWSATMSSTLMLYCVLATWMVGSIESITVSIDRSDLKPAPTRSSMIANGWRPLASSYEETIGTNVSPSSNLERNAPLHPVLGKFQEHMATSDKQKPPRKSKPTPHHDYSPPSILGSFTVLGNAAAKARPEIPTHQQPNKYSNAENQEYTFLIPPPKNVFRFEMDQQRKPVVRENGAYPRQPQYIPQQVHHDPIRAATYFIKGYVGSTNSPNNGHHHQQQSAPSKNRPFVTSYAIPQQLFQQPPPRQQSKPFESLKINNAKPYLQPPGSNAPADFAKEKHVNEQDRRVNYDRYQAQAQTGQVIGPSGTGNFYTQVNHPSHQYKSSYERDPSFLVHESHEISYVTPPAVYTGYNIRPSTPYESLLPPGVFSSPATSSLPASTPVTSSTTVSPHLREPGTYVHSNELVRTEQEFKRNRPGSGNSGVKQVENTIYGNILPGTGLGSTYYVSENQDLTPPPSSWPIPKTKYTSDINEVLPRVNPPTKFSQETEIPSAHVEQVPKVVYTSPQVQQQHYQSSAVPIAPHQQTSQPEYETPESISLKHFNEQQFLIQQQLIQRDRQRLAEQERQQQLEIERQQREELKRRQEELKKLLQKEEEEARRQEEAAKLNSEVQQQGLTVKLTDTQTPYTIQLAQYEIPKVTTPTESTIRVSEPSLRPEQPQTQQPQILQPVTEILEQPIRQNVQEQLQQQVDYREPQPEKRPYRPQKPLREQYRRRKPTTVNYDLSSATEAPTPLPETLLPVTPAVEELSSVYTTSVPETLTHPVTVNSQRPRTRRPGLPGRRRRPTTTTEEPATVQNFEEDYLKYDRPDNNLKYDRPEQQPSVDSRRRRVKPASQNTYQETLTEKRPNIRKRPGHRVRINPGEPFDAEIVTEIVQAPVNPYRETVDTLKNYEENVEATERPIEKPSDYSSIQTVQNYSEVVTEIPQYVYQAENTRDRPDGYTGQEDYRYQQQNFNTDTNIPLEDLFGKTDGNYVEKVTTEPAISSTPSTSTTTSPPVTQSTQVSVSTTRSLKTRPLRYGNTTRPRFSIKDYKTRMDYKNKLAHMSTTESSPSQPVKQRQNLKSQQSQSTAQPNEQPSKETTGRYKYVSRVNYRTSTAAPNAQNERDNSQTGVEDGPSTTERINRFTPKRRPANGNVYRSRIANSNKSQQQSEGGESSSRLSTVRPENVFSSAIRRRPIMKSKLHINKPSAAQTYTQSEKKETAAEVPTEMAAEETSFYSAVTTSASRVNNNEIESAVKTASEANEFENVETTVESEEPVEQLEKTNDEVRQTYQTNTERKETEGTSNTAEISSNGSVNVVESSKYHFNQPNSNVPDHSGKVETSTFAAESSSYSHSLAEVAASGESSHDSLKQNEPNPESTTKFDIRSDEEELFAKASQSVADLTSSASALYDKPGMFKAVSPESRVVSPHFKITTDEPTLPIEAFFQELSKKN